MRKSWVVLLLLGSSVSSLGACTLSASERQAYLYQAVQLLSPTAASQPPQTGTFRVTAEQYYDNVRSRYIPVKKVSVHQYRSWATERTEWNSGRVDRFEMRYSEAQVGQYYQVRVDWEDGKSATTESQMRQGGTTVTVSEPD